MTMHLVRGMSSLSTKKRKAKKKTKAVIAEEKKMEALLKRVGYKGGGINHRYELPNLRSETFSIPTSNNCIGNGIAKERSIYTGNEIAGIVTTHKSNLMPVRKDNKQAAIDAANMRR